MKENIVKTIRWIAVLPISICLFVIIKPVTYYVLSLIGSISFAIMGFQASLTSSSYVDPDTSSSVLRFLAMCIPLVITVLDQAIRTSFSIIMGVLIAPKFKFYTLISLSSIMFFISMGILLLIMFGVIVTPDLSRKDWYSFVFFLLNIIGSLIGIFICFEYKQLFIKEDN